LVAGHLVPALTGRGVKQTRHLFLYDGSHPVTLHHFLNQKETKPTTKTPPQHFFSATQWTDGGFCTPAVERSESPDGDAM
jgi:hypothetical protein